MPIQLRPVEYQVVTANDAKEMSRRVTELLEKGYVPHFDLKANLASSSTQYVQAMVRLDAVNVNIPQVHPGGGILVPQ